MWVNETRAMPLPTAQHAVVEELEAEGVAQAVGRILIERRLIASHAALMLVSHLLVRQSIALGDAGIWVMKAGRSMRQTIWTVSLKKSVCAAGSSVYVCVSCAP